MPFINPKDAYEEFVDGVFFQSAPTPDVVPVNPCPSSSASPPPPYQGPSSSFAQPPTDDPSHEFSFADDWVESLFPSYPPPPSFYGGPDRW